MKSWIVALDLGALGLIWLLLRGFGKHSAWLAVSGLSLIYHLRFWSLYYFTLGSADVGILGTAYGGTSFFDFMVVWLEFAPFFTALASIAVQRKRKSSHKMGEGV